MFVFFSAMAVKMSSQFATMGRRIFDISDANDHKMYNLWFGKFLWKGTFSSARIGWELRLNVDMANRPGYKQSELKTSLLHLDSSEIHSHD